MKKVLLRRGVFSILLAASIVSCKKENVSPLNGNLSSKSQILKFENQSELTERLNFVLSANLEELIQYEDSKNFKSFGRISDEIYNKSNIENLKSQDELMNFVNLNSDFVRVIKDEQNENVFETVLSSIPYRYLANIDQLFRVNNFVYKVYEDGLVATNVKNVSKLKSLNPKSLSELESSDEFRVMLFKREVKYTNKDVANNCGTYASSSSTNTNDRTKIEMGIGYYDFYDINNVPITALNNSVIVRPYKKTLGIWYYCTRTLSCDIKVAVDILKTTGWDRTYHYKYEAGKSDSKLEYVLDGGVISVGVFARYNMHYGGYKCWADSPSTSPAFLNCNVHLF